MKTQSIDTSISTEKVLISMIRKVPMAKKFLQVRSLSQTTIQLSKRAIARSNPDLTEMQHNILFVKYHYGKKLVKDLEQYIKNKNYHASS